MLIMILALSACKNEVEVNAPYRETAVVYGLIDAESREQPIRISKTFQSEKNVIEEAQTEALYFDALDVSLTCIENGRTWQMALKQYPKDEGIFNSTRNDVYVNADTLAPVPGTRYELRITNKKDGRQFTGSTVVLGEPAQLPDTARQFTSGHNSLTFAPNRMARVYDVLVRMRYVEGDSATPETVTAKKIDYFILRNAMIDTTRQRYYEATILGISFYNYLRSVMSYKERTFRRIKGVDFIWVGGSSDFRDMILQQIPSVGIIQKKTEYSNITNGLGIFSSRNTYTRNMQVDVSMMSLLRSLPNMIE